ncbi:MULTISPECIES: hypothetical protein [unclassified Tychonema]|uniref:hypothetical protein n=1 Tax=unclassified Tychonema TaxID=2642144 RepID=UPI001882672A|nr:MULTISPECIES: hypothetical protein [unclassified Tychonema]
MQPVINPMVRLYYTQILTVLRFFEGLLAEQFSLAEVVAGTAMPSVGMFEISFDEKSPRYKQSPLLAHSRNS